MNPLGDVVIRPRIRRSDYAHSRSHDAHSREVGTEIGWPSLHVWKRSNFHTYKGDEKRQDTEIGFAVGPFRGLYLTVSAGDGCYPDTDEEGWPQ